MPCVQQIVMNKSILRALKYYNITLIIIIIIKIPYYLDAIAQIMRAPIVNTGKLINKYSTQIKYCINKYPNKKTFFSRTFMIFRIRDRYFGNKGLREPTCSLQIDWLALFQLPRSQEFFKRPSF